MPFNGSGTYSLPAGNPVVTGTTISSTVQNNTMSDVATALTTCVTKDGQTTPTANLPMGGFKLTGLAVGSAATDSVAVSQLQNPSVNWVAAGGTADAITATYSPAIGSLADGQLCFFRASAANATTTPTFSPNGLTARTIVLEGGSALRVGEIPAANAEVILRYNLANTRWELLNPAFARIGANADITSMTAVTAIDRTGGTAITGTNTNDDAAAGRVGEYIESVIASGSAVGLTSGASANVTSISLTAGDWDVSGNVIFLTAAGTSVTQVQGSISSTSATSDVTSLQKIAMAAFVPGAVSGFACTPNTVRKSLASTTTIYLVANSVFTISTNSAYGVISARRVR